MPAIAPAVGPQGPEGPEGPQGPQGPEGVSGSVGNRVIALGDSVTIGSTSGVENANRNDYLMWASMLSNGRVIYLRNAGVSGNRADQMLAVRERVGVRIEDVGVEQLRRRCARHRPSRS